MFYLNNHTATWPNYHGPVAELESLKPANILKIMPLCKDLASATHGAVHLDEGELDEIKETWEKLESNDLILIRVSAGGKEVLTNGKHMCWSKRAPDRQRRAFILNVRDYSALGKLSLAEFCSITVDQAEKIVAEDLESIPPSLRRLFSRSNTHHLLALDILCQGYLAAHGLLVMPGKSKMDIACGQLEEFAASTENTRWWLRGLGVSGFQQLEDRLIEAFVSPDDAKSMADFIRKRLITMEYDTHPICQLRTRLRDYIS